MRLTRLEPTFLRYEIRKGYSDPNVAPAGGQFGEPHNAEFIVTVDTLADADGISFICPKCYVDNHGPIGTHTVICWFRGKVPGAAEPGPGRWTPSGTGFDDLTFVPGEPAMATSVLLTGGCGWHGHLVNGEVT